MWLLGVVCCSCGSFMLALGLVLQKYSHLKERGRGKGSNNYFDPWWALGFGIYVVGQVLNFMAMAWAPQAMLGALGASSLAYLALLAWALLGESMERLELCALVFTLLGVIMVILAVPEADGAHGSSPHEIAGHLFEPDFVGILVGFAAFLALGWGILAVVMPGFTAGLGMLWTALTAVLAGYTVTLWKCVSMLLFGASHAWACWQFYLIAALAAVACVVQVHTLNQALSLCAAKTVVPMTFALGVLIQIMNAQVAFEELGDMKRHTVFWAGVAMVLASMVCIVQIQLSSEEEDEELGFAEAGSPKKQVDKRQPKFQRSQSTNPQDMSQITKSRRGRRHSSYFGIRETGGGCRGRVFPLGSSGLVIMT